MRNPLKILSSALAAAVSYCTEWIAEKLHNTPIGRIISMDLLRYAICGVGNYIVLDALLYFTTYHYIIGENTFLNLGFVSISPHILSLIIVFPITLLTGFWLNRHVAFGSTQMAIGKQLMRYIISIGGSILLSYIILKLLIETLGIWPTPAKITCSLLTAIYSYLMARFYTFQQTKK